MSGIYRVPEGSPEKYLRQFDLHNHTFSFCVNEAEHLTEQAWTRDVPDTEEKLHKIAERLGRLMRAAEMGGTRALAVTEHPQYTFYDIPFLRYMRLFRERSRSLNAYWGLEVDLEIGKGNAAFVNEDVIGNARVGSRAELIENAQVFVGALHVARPWRDRFYQNAQVVSAEDVVNCVKDRDDYFLLSMNAIDAFGAFKKRVQAEFRGKRAFVYGHPWGAAAAINKQFLKLRDPKSRLTQTRLMHVIRQDSKTIIDEMLEYQWGGSAPISFFTHEQLAAISDRLIEQEIYLELNRKYVARGASELNEVWKGPSLLEVYIDRAHAKGVVPWISICSDAHVSDEFRIGNLENMCKRVPNIKDARVWVEQF